MSLLASSIGSIFQPFYRFFAFLIASVYSIIPNYAVAIALLTIAVMIVVFPITLKGTRGMVKMSLLAPELKIIQNRYKAKPGMTVEERQQARQKLNEEMMALYKENDASPTGGCLPQVLQIPVFVVLYGTIRGLTHEVKGNPAPLYISHSTRMYKDILTGHGKLHALGINLADSVRTSSSFGAKIPFIVMILIAIGLQYFQMRQINNRNPNAAAANPQMQTMQRVMPLFFAFIYISIPAGVNVYFIVSNLFRIAQQSAMYRWDPQLKTTMASIQARGAPRTTTAVQATSLRQRFREAAGAAQAEQTVVAPKITPPRPFIPPTNTNRSKSKRTRRSR